MKCNTCGKPNAKIKTMLGSYCSEECRAEVTMRVFRLLAFNESTLKDSEKGRKE